MIPLGYFGPSPYITPIPLAVVQHFSRPMQRAFVCLVIGHYLHQIRPSKVERAELWFRFHTEMGLSLRGTSEDIAVAKDAIGLDFTVFNIMFLMLVDVSARDSPAWPPTPRCDSTHADLFPSQITRLINEQLSYGSPQNWRVHFLAAMKTLACRGGVKQVYERRIPLQATIKYFLM